VQSRLFTYAVALGALIAAIALRALLDPFLGDTLPFVTLFGAVAVAVWTGGLGVAVTTGLLGYVACHLLFLQPRGTLDLSSARDVVGLAAYLFTCALIMLIGEAMRAARRRASERGEALLASLAERQKFMTLVETSTDFIGMCDLAGVPFYVNPAGLRMVGLDNLEQARRTHVREFFLPADQAKIMEEFFPSVVENGHGEIEVRFRKFRTGATRWMAYKVLALTDTTGRRYGFATVSQDVSERRRLEDSLRSMASDLSDADRRKNEFLATLAHELRNPLAPLSNTLAVLKRTGGCPSTLDWCIDNMERQVGQIVRLVDDLLEVSRITHGRLDLRKSRIELAAVIEQAVQACAPLARSCGHEVLVRLPREPISLHADPARLVQVFSNLLNNACKYTPEGGKIGLDVERQGNYAAITVEDNGVGIPHDKLHRIFDMFMQVDQSLERSRGGLGIGLVLVKRLVEMHGGSVEASSGGEGLGTRFVIRLPAAFDQPKAVAQIANAASETAQRRSILIVDDNRDAAESLALLLRPISREIHVAHDGEAGLEAAKRHRPDIVLLDIGLPKLNGHEVCRHLRKEQWGSEMVIVALTGWGQENDRRETREAGFDGHLTKPVPYAALTEFLAQACTGKNAVAA
jgi:PAS domain S-box-containing protein